MGMTVQRRKDTATPRYFQHKVADIRGGVSVNTTELGSDFLHEASVLSAPVNGICHVVKIAEVVAAVAAADTTIKVKKGHQFSVGDAILTAEKGNAVVITAISKTDKASDTITVGAALGAISLGGFICQADKAADSNAKLKYEPLALVGTGKPIVQGQNLDTDAWLIGVTKGVPLPDFIANKLKGIINY